MPERQLMELKGLAWSMHQTISSAAVWALSTTIYVYTHTLLLAEFAISIAKGRCCS